MLEKFQTFQLASEFYQACKDLKIPRFLKEQLNRASASVALNLAEGSGKFSPLEQRRYYGIALGSMRECEAVLNLEKVKDEKLNRLSRRLGAILFCLAHPEKNKK